MADIVSPEVRSRMMAGIRGKNTKIEVEIRRALFARKLRYRLHDRSLPGRPDIVLSKHKAVILVHGCYWHGHQCDLYKEPKTNADFWIKKIQSNRNRDSKNEEELQQLGWRVAVVWECALRGQGPEAVGDVADKLFAWIMNAGRRIEIRG
ncbi:MAG: very short patch repair endonuclease [Ferrovibrio sp.]